MFNEAQLKTSGFSGFVAVRNLRNEISVVPEVTGVYVVLSQSVSKPAFSHVSTGGWFKGEDPTVLVDRLEKEWVPGSELLYVGSSNNLRRRVTELLRFGGGAPIGHRGGRLIWQIEDPDGLIVAWKPTIDHKPAESEMLDDFFRHFERLPFANLRR